MLCSFERAVRWLLGQLASTACFAVLDVLAGGCWVNWLPLHVLQFWMCCQVVVGTIGFHCMLCSFECAGTWLLEQLTSPACFEVLNVLAGGCWVNWLPLHVLQFWMCWQVVVGSIGFHCMFCSFGCAGRWLLGQLASTACFAVLDVLAGGCWVNWGGEPMTTNGDFGELRQRFDLESP